MQEQFTIAEAAPLLGVTEACLYRLCREKRITHRRLGGTGRGMIRLTQAWIDEYLDARTIVASEPSTPSRGSGKARPSVQTARRKPARSRERLYTRVKGGS